MGYINWQELLFTVKFPDFDNSWNDDAKRAWFDMFFKIVKLVLNNNEEERMHEVRIYQAYLIWRKISI